MDNPNQNNRQNDLMADDLYYNANSDIKAACDRIMKSKEMISCLDVFIKAMIYHNEHQKREGRVAREEFSKVGEFEEFIKLAVRYKLIDSVISILSDALRLAATGFTASSSSAILSENLGRSSSAFQLLLWLVASRQGYKAMSVGHYSECMNASLAIIDKVLDDGQDLKEEYFKKFASYGGLFRHSGTTLSVTSFLGSILIGCYRFLPIIDSGFRDAMRQELLNMMPEGSSQENVDEVINYVLYGVPIISAFGKALACSAAILRGSGLLKGGDTGFNGLLSRLSRFSNSVNFCTAYQENNFLIDRRGFKDIYRSIQNKIVEKLQDGNSEAQIKSLFEDYQLSASNLAKDMFANQGLKKNFIMSGKKFGYGALLSIYGFSYQVLYFLKSRRRPAVNAKNRVTDREMDQLERGGRDSTTEADLHQVEAQVIAMENETNTDEAQRGVDQSPKGHWFAGDFFAPQGVPIGPALRSGYVPVSSRTGTPMGSPARFGRAGSDNGSRERVGGDSEIPSSSNFSGYFNKSGHSISDESMGDNSSHAVSNFGSPCLRPRVASDYLCNTEPFRPIPTGGRLGTSPSNHLSARSSDTDNLVPTALSPAADSKKKYVPQPGQFMLLDSKARDQNLLVMRHLSGLPSYSDSRDQGPTTSKQIYNQESLSRVTNLREGGAGGCDNARS